MGIVTPWYQMYPVVAPSLSQMQGSIQVTDKQPLYDDPGITGTYFFPMPGGPLPGQGRSGPVALSLPDGTAIGGYWCRELDGAPTMLYLHGNGECVGDQLNHWPHWAAEAGANIFFVDYPGYATSDGVPTFTSCRLAAAAALEHLLSRPEHEVPGVVLAGRSVGSIFALDAAASCPPARLRGLLLESGVADIAPRLQIRVAYERLGIDRAELERQLARDYDHRQKMESLACPVTILHTRHDSLVPCHNSEQLAAWAGARLVRLELFDQGDHNTIQWLNRGAYQEHLAELLARWSAPTVQAPG